MNWSDGRHNSVYTRDSMAMRSPSYDLDELQRVNRGRLGLECRSMKEVGLILNARYGYVCGHQRTAHMGLHREENELLRHKRWYGGVLVEYLMIPNSSN